MIPGFEGMAKVFLWAFGVWGAATIGGYLIAGLSGMTFGFFMGTLLAIIVGLSVAVIQSR